VPIGEAIATFLLTDHGHQQATAYLRPLTGYVGIGGENAADLGQSLQHDEGTRPHDVYPILMTTVLTILPQRCMMEG
jgi:hypothetical protein